MTIFPLVFSLTFLFIVFGAVVFETDSSAPNGCKMLPETS